MTELDKALAWHDSLDGACPLSPEAHVLVDAARAYADLVNGERVEPDFEALQDIAEKYLSFWDWDVALSVLRQAVAAAIGDRLLIDPPKEEE